MHLVHSSPWSFSVYSPDMPSRLPIQDICAGLLTSVGTAIRYWFHYTLVAFAWLGVVPLTACEYHSSEHHRSFPSVIICAQVRSEFVFLYTMTCWCNPNPDVQVRWHSDAAVYIHPLVFSYLSVDLLYVCSTKGTPDFHFVVQPCLSKDN